MIGVIVLLLASNAFAVALWWSQMKLTDEALAVCRAYEKRLVGAASETPSGFLSPGERQRMFRNRQK